MTDFDLEAADREGLIPINCRRCGSVLAMQSKDGNELRVNNLATTFGRVALNCSCGYTTSWRPSRGPKPQAPGTQPLTGST